jgi:protein gp37
MSEHTAISWTGHTFNTHWGCSKISPGCDGCYAERLAARFGYGWGNDAPKREFGPEHWNELLRWDRKAAADGVRRRVFTNSMSDLFDKFAPEGVRERHFEFITRTPHLDHLLLTKRISNVKGMLPADWGGGYPNVWLGATVVNQEEADRDIPKLLATPARVRFLSIEPMLGAIDLQKPCTARCLNRGCCFPLRGHLNERCVVDSEAGGITVECICSRLNGLHWVIAGGESGPHARPSHPDWFRSLRDHCAAAGVPFLFKQWGEWAPDDGSGGFDGITRALRASQRGTHRIRGGDDLYRYGKAAAGRLLDGVEHNGFPA